MLVDLLMDMRVCQAGSRNPEGNRILEFGDETEMVVANTLFKKRGSRSDIPMRQLKQPA